MSTLHHRLLGDAFESINVFPGAPLEPIVRNIATFRKDHANRRLKREFNCMISVIEFEWAKRSDFLQGIKSLITGWSV